MNYGELRDQIRNYSELSDNGLSDSTVAVIVQNAENRMYRETAIDAFKLYASAITLTGVSTISVPSGLRNIRYVEMINGSGEIVNLLQKDSSFLGEYNNEPSNSSTYGEPKYWADWNATTWFVAPTPDDNYTINIAYLQQPATITTSTTSTSYISTYAQDALLYCCLTETYKYLKGPADMIQVYEQSYQQAVRTFADEQLGLRRRDEYKDGELRIPLNTPSK
jgi:hypothetical protein